MQLELIREEGVGTPGSVSTAKVGGGTGGVHHLGGRRSRVGVGMGLVARYNHPGGQHRYRGKQVLGEFEGDQRRGSNFG